MKQKKRAKRRAKNSTTEIKALLTAFALTATLGGWVGFSLPASGEVAGDLLAAPVTGASEQISGLRSVTGALRPVTITRTRSSR